MSHSTHAGFNGPGVERPTRSARVSSPRRLLAFEASDGGRVRRASLAVGVGQLAAQVAASRRSTRRTPGPYRFAIPDPSASLAFGVGHNRPFPGDDPDPVTVGSANVPGAEHTPFRIEPETGQVPENVPQASSEEPTHILHDDVAWSYRANGPRKEGP